MIDESAGFDRGPLDMRSRDAARGGQRRHGREAPCSRQAAVPTLGGAV